MKHNLRDLSNFVLKEKMAGKSFVEISEICKILNPDFIELVYMWKKSHEPIFWKQQYFDLELLRNDALHAAYWADAIAGDSKAAQVILKVNNSRMKLVERLENFPVDKLEEALKLKIENQLDLLEVETILKDQLKEINKILEGFDFSYH
jgi:ATP-dependent Lon protease